MRDRKIAGGQPSPAAGNKKEDLNPQVAEDIDEAVEAPGCEMGEAIDLRVALAQCQKELQEAKNDYLRAHADFDNFRKRMRAERDQEFTRGSERVLADLLNVVDDFERALCAVNDNSTVDSLKEGVDLIYRNLLCLLDKNGIKPMQAEGQPFDPQYHDAIARFATAEQPEHTVYSEIQRGYIKNGDVFRPAKVVVSVTPEETE